MSNSIQRIRNLINEINFFSSIKDGTFLNVSFSHLLSIALDNVIPDTIEVSIEPVPDDKIYSNPNLISISLEKILSNSVESIQHKKAQGGIKIKYFRAKSLFTIEIEDNGGGIMEPERVFEPFYTTYHQNKGLGMTFVYHAMKTLNGEINVENIEQGSRVTLKLPDLNVTV